MSEICYKSICERIVNKLEIDDPKNEYRLEMWYNGYNEKLNSYTYSAVIVSYGSHPIEFSFHSRVWNNCMTEEDAYKFLIIDYLRKTQHIKLDFSCIEEILIELDLLGI